MAEPQLLSDTGAADRHTSDSNDTTLSSVELNQNLDSFGTPVRNQTSQSDSLLSVMSSQASLRSVASYSTDIIEDLSDSTHKSTNMNGLLSLAHDRSSLLVRTSISVSHPSQNVQLTISEPISQGAGCLTLPSDLMDMSSPQNLKQLSFSSILRSITSVVSDAQKLKSLRITIPPMEFTLFNRLPLELRLLIWKDVPYTPRLIGIRGRIQSNQSLSAILHTTRESRRVALENFEDFSTLFSSILIAWREDTVFFEYDAPGMGASNYCVTTEAVRSKCQNIAVRCPEFDSLNPTIVAMRHDACMERFAKYEELKSVTFLTSNSSWSDQVPLVSEIQVREVCNKTKQVILKERNFVYHLSLHEELKESRDNTIKEVRFLEYDPEPLYISDDE